VPGAISFTLTFATDELAKKFVQRAGLAFSVPTLRYDNVVHVIVENGTEMREVLAIGRQLGGIGGA
jgi:hypothetical protein